MRRVFGISNNTNNTQNSKNKKTSEHSSGKVICFNTSKNEIKYKSAQTDVREHSKHFDWK